MVRNLPYSERVLEIVIGEGKMGRPTGSAILLLLTLIAGCSGESGTSSRDNTKPPALTAATLGEQSVLTIAEYLAAAPYVDADRGKGERQAQICKACHSLDKGGRNTIGPNLYGFFGSPAAAVDGFDYSAALRESEFVWTPRALDAWLAQPSRFLPGNRMTFAGVPKAEDRANLIAYLLEVTGSEE